METMETRIEVLPGDLVVYQLGEQIVVLDLNHRQLGLLALGRSPVVALRAKPQGVGRQSRQGEKVSTTRDSLPSS